MNFRARIWRFFRVLLVNQVNLKRMCRNFNWITFISVNFAVSWASNTTNLPKSFSKNQKIHKIFLKKNFFDFDWLLDVIHDPFLKKNVNVLLIAIKCRPHHTLTWTLISQNLHWYSLTMLRISSTKLHKFTSFRFFVATFTNYRWNFFCMSIETIDINVA